MRKIKGSLKGNAGSLKSEDKEKAIHVQRPQGMWRTMRICELRLELLGWWAQILCPFADFYCLGCQFEGG